MTGRLGGTLRICVLFAGCLGVSACSIPSGANPSASPLGIPVSTAHGTASSVPPSAKSQGGHQSAGAPGAVAAGGGNQGTSSGPLGSGGATAVPANRAAPTPFHGAFSASFSSQTLQSTSCPSDAPVGATCLAYTGQGTSPELGDVAFQRTDVWDRPVNSNCAPATTRGRFFFFGASGDYADFSGSGHWCADSSATYSVTFSGGGGSYGSARGTAEITVTAETGSGKPESWRGTLS